MIVRPHGVKGEVKVIPLTADSSRFNLLKNVFIDGSRIELTSVKFSGKYVILKLAGYDSIDSIKRIINNYVCIRPVDTIKKNDGEYFYFELEGLQVETESGEKLGVVEEIQDMPANKVLSIRGIEGNEILLPFLKSIVKKVDIDNGRITVELLKGLI